MDTLGMDMPRETADLRHILLELEVKIKQTSGVMRQLGAIFPEEDLGAENSDNNTNTTNNNNDANGGGAKVNPTATASIAEAVVTPLEELQKYVDACDTLIHDRLAHLRHQVDLAVEVSKSYQKMFPEHHERVCAAAAANAPGGPPAAESHTPIGGNICYEDVRQYLSRFIRWDPLELDRVTNAASVVADEAQRRAPSSKSGGGDGNERQSLLLPNSQSPSSRIEGSQATALSPALSSTPRRSLNAVVNDLLLRQLQYDGIPLTTAMEMELGCYDGMTAESNANSSAEYTSGDFMISQEIRRGLLQPRAEADDAGDLIQMVQNAYPHTVHWISRIVNLCNISATTHHGTRGAVDEMATSSPPVDGATSMRRQQEDRRRSEWVAESTFLTESGLMEVPQRGEGGDVDNEEGFALEYDLQHPQNSGEVWLTVQVPPPFTSTWESGQEAGAEGEEGAAVLAGATMRGPRHGGESEPSEEANSPDAEVSWSYTEGEEEEDEDDREEEEEELEYVEEQEGEQEEEGEEAEEIEIDMVIYPGAPTAAHRRHRRHQPHLHDQQQLQHKQHEGGDMNGGDDPASLKGEESVPLVVAATQQAKILLSDLVIICALQRLSQMVSCGGDASMNSTLQQAVEFVLTLRRHPLVAWRMTFEQEFQRANAGHGNKGGKAQMYNMEAPSLLLTFHHIFVALGYMPLSLSEDQRKNQHQSPSRRNSNDGELKDDNTAHTRCVQEQLLLCVAPFLRLWCGRHHQGFDGLVSVDIPHDAGDEEGGSMHAPALPICTVPYVWRECVLFELLDQVHKLHQLEALLVTHSESPTSSTAAAAPPPTATTTNTLHPENLLYRLVYPLSSFMLSRLDDYCEKGLVGGFEEEQQQYHPQQPITSPPLPSNPPPLPPFQQQQQQPSAAPSDSARRHGLSALRTLFPGFASSRSRDRATTDEMSSGGNGGGVGGNNSSNVFSAQRQTPPLPQTRRQHAIILELPHATAVLSQQDELRRRATPSLLFPQKPTCFHSANPTLFMDSYLLWQPLFQKTMCYCPVTRRRCLDTLLFGVNPERPQEVLSTSSNRPAFNLALLLMCGHVISNRAIVSLLERPQRQSRAQATSARCPYCTAETPLDQLMMLHGIY